MSLNKEKLFPKKPRIVFMGTPDFSVPALDSLIRNNYDAIAVVTQPDRPSGRGRQVVFSPVKDMAVKNNIRILQPEKVNTNVFYDLLRSLKPDIFIVIAFGHILKKELFDIPEYGSFNIHASLLPKYRGAAPIHHTILNDDPDTGLTLIRMDEGMDTGPVVMQEELAVLEDETFGSLYERLSQKSRDLVVKFLRGAAGIKVDEQPQDDSKASYAPKPDQGSSPVNWSESARNISCLVRALDPRPGAWTLLNGERMKLFSSRVFDHEYSSGCPGRVHLEPKGMFLVETGRGIVEIREVQLPGKKRIPAADFLNGYLVQKGTVLG